MQHAESDKKLQQLKSAIREFKKYGGRLRPRRPAQEQEGDISDEEFLVSARHQLVLIMFLPFARTVSCSENASRWGETIEIKNLTI